MNQSDIIAEELQRLKDQFRSFKYIPLKIFIQMIDLECKLRPRKIKR